MRNSMFVLLATLVVAGNAQAETPIEKCRKENPADATAVKDCLKQVRQEQQKAAEDVAKAAQAAGDSAAAQQVLTDVQRIERLECELEEATKALAWCDPKGKSLADRLRRLPQCNKRELAKAEKKFAEKAKELETAIAGLDERTTAIEGRLSRVEGGLKGTVERIELVENSTNEGFEIVSQTIDGMYPQAELVLGLVNHRDGMGFAIGAGLSLPVAKGDGRLQAEALGSVGSGTVGFTAIGRGLTTIGDSPFVGGLNVRFHIEGSEFSGRPDALFMGAGVSAGWSGERFGFIADIAAGSQAHGVGKSDAAWASSLLAQVKF